MALTGRSSRLRRLHNLARGEMRVPVALSIRALGLMLVFAAATAAQDGAAVFQANCATCHAAADDAQQAKSPSIDVLRRLSTEAIVNALLNGKMRIQAVALSDAQRRSVSEFLGGRPLEPPAAASSVMPCSRTSPFPGPSGSSEWNGWGNGIRNTRFTRDGGLGAKDLPKLTLKWAFGYAGVTSARAQPAL